MQIKRRLQINVAISLLTAIVICLVLLLSLYRLKKANNSAKIAGDIITDSLESVILRNDYIRNDNERAKEQWFTKNEQISKFLKLALENFRNAKDRKNIAGFIEDQESIGIIFSAIVANREKSGLNAGSGDLSHEVEERLLSQLDMRVYEVAIHGRKLLESSREARYSALRLVVGGVIASFLFIIALAAVNSWAMGRAITDRVTRLRDGASMIGGGDLDHRIEIKGDDEFAELSQAFNTMTAKLRATYDDLANEIQERRLTEETLRESEQNYHQLNETLEQRITKAVHELRDKDRMLIIQGRQAVMGEMISNISHQWRQPLNMLGLLAQELQATYKHGMFSTEYVDTNVKKTMELIQHMSKTIDDFRNFFKSDKERVRFRVLEVIEKTMSLLEGGFKAHGIRSEIKETGDPSINGYPNEFAQVLLNIVSNAREALLAAKVEDPTITIRLYTEGDKAVVTISDNAGGIPEDIIEKIFEPYFTTKGPEKGTGIGLYMSKTIIENNMGGSLTARNTGGGAEFRIEV